MPAVDFLSLVDTPYVWELNMWYHTLNVGFRTRISGETDFPCIYGERVGLGRSYVKLDGKLTYAAWCEGIQRGHNYVSDGRSHLLDFKVNGAVMGEDGSELRLAEPGEVRATVTVAAFLDETPNSDLPDRPYSQKPYWDIQRARLGQTREVPVELIVNGYPVARQVLLADGGFREVSFATRVEQSSWVAVRILPPPTPTRSSCSWAVNRFARRRRAPSGACRASINAGRKRNGSSKPTKWRMPKRPTTMPGSATAACWPNVNPAAPLTPGQNPASSSRSGPSIWVKEALVLTTRIRDFLRRRGQRLIPQGLEALLQVIAFGVPGLSFQILGQLLPQARQRLVPHLPDPGAGHPKLKCDRIQTPEAALHSGQSRGSALGLTWRPDLSGAGAIFDQAQRFRNRLRLLAGELVREREITLAVGRDRRIRERCG